MVFCTAFVWFRSLVFSVVNVTSDDGSASVDHRHRLRFCCLSAEMCHFIPGEAARKCPVPFQERVNLVRAQVEFQRNFDFRVGEIILSFWFHQFSCLGAIKGEWSKSVLVKPQGLRIQVIGFRDSGFRIEDVSNLKILPAPNLSILGPGFDIKV